MIAKFNDNILKEEFLSEGAHIAYEHLRGYSRNKDIYLVIGIFFVSGKTILVICPNDSPSLISLFDAEFFTIIEDSFDENWRLFINYSSQVFLYPDVDFKNFSYIGVGALIDDVSFFPKLLDDELVSCNYISSILNKGYYEYRPL